MQIQELEFLKISYSDYIGYLKKLGYHKEELNIDETSEIVEKLDLAKGSIGTVLSIRCPSRYKIIIIGKNQLSENAKIETAHTISVRFTDSNNQEISPDTRIRLIKERPSMSIYSIATMFYKDITSTLYTKNIHQDETKPYEKLYRLNDGIELNGSDRLNFEVINPDVTINHNNVRLSLDMDLWELD